MFLKRAVAEDLLRKSVLIHQYLQLQQDLLEKEKKIRAEQELKSKLGYDYDKILYNKLLSGIIPEIATKNTILPFQLNLGVPIGETAFANTGLNKKIMEYILNQTFMDSIVNITPNIVELASQLSYLNFINAINRNQSVNDIIRAASEFDPVDIQLANRPLI